MPSTRDTIKQNALASGLLLALVVCCYRNVLFRPGLIVGDDSIASFYHFLSFASGEIKGGRGLPWWCPHIYCGVPFIASLMAPVFHPVMLLFLAFRTEVAYHLSIVLSSWAAGTFMLLYLRVMGLRLFPALVGALALIFSGWVVTDAFHYERVQTFLHLPLLMFCLEKAIRTGRLKWFACAGIAAALQVHMTNVQVALYCQAFAACYLAARFAMNCWDPARRDRVGRMVSGAVLSGVVAAGLSAPLVLPTIAFLPQTSRAERTYEFATSGSLPPEEVAELFLRNPFGNWRNSKYFAFKPGKRSAYYWGRFRIARLQAEYVGAMTCLLVVLGAALSTRRRLRWFCVVSVAATVLLALGRYTPVFGLVWAVVPGLSMFRGPAKWTLITVFPLSVLAALGAEVVFSVSGAEAARRPRRVLVGTAIAFQVVAVAGFAGWHLCRDQIISLYGIRDRDWLLMHSTELFRMQGWQEVTQHVHAALLQTAAWATGAAALLALVMGIRPQLDGRPVLRTLAYVTVAGYLLADLWSFEHEHLVNCPGASAYLRGGEVVDVIRADRLKRFSTDLTLRLIPNKAMTFGIDCVEGYLPYRDARLRTLMMHLRRAPQGMLEFMGTGLIVVQGGVLRGTGFDLLYDSTEDDRASPPFPPRLPERDGWSLQRQPLRVYRNRGALPRAFVVDAFKVLSPEQILHQLGTKEIDMTREVALEEPPPGLDGAGVAGRKTLKPVEIVRFDPCERVFRVETDKPALLVTSETFDPGWQAAITTETPGRELATKNAPVLRANYAFQAVPLPAGRHEVRLSYRPRLWRVGLAAAALAALLVVAAAVHGQFSVEK